MNEDEERPWREAFVWLMSQSPELYREVVKSIEGGAAYFRKRWEKDFGQVVDVSSFTDDEIIEKMLEIQTHIKWS